MKKLVMTVCILCYVTLANGIFDHDRAVRDAQRNQWDDSLNRLHSCIAQQPDDPVLLYDAGVAAYKAGKYTLARDYFDRTIKATGVAATLREQAYFNLGNALVAHNTLEDAIKAYEQALALDPSDERAKKNLELVRKMLQKQQQEKQQEDKKNQSNQDKQNKNEQNKQQDKQQQDGANKDQQKQDSTKQDQQQQDNKDGQQQQDKKGDQQQGKQHKQDNGNEQSKQGSGTQQGEQQGNQPNTKAGEQQGQGQDKGQQQGSGKQDKSQGGTPGDYKPSKAQQDGTHGQQQQQQEQKKPGAGSKQEQAADISQEQRGTQDGKQHAGRAASQQGTKKAPKPSVDGRLLAIMNAEEKDDAATSKGFIRGMVDEKLAGQEGEHCW